MSIPTAIAGLNCHGRARILKIGGRVLRKGGRGHDGKMLSKHEAF
jgi:hypothetical protein